METKKVEVNHGIAVTLTTVCFALALLATSCGVGGAGGAAADPVSASGFSVSPTNLTFGNQAVGSTSTVHPATLTNVGNAALTLSGIQVTGPNAGDFSSTNTCGSSLGPSAQCTLSITLTPSSTGARTASVVFTDNATGSPQTVNLTGTGTAAGVDLSTNTLTFGSQLQNTPSPAQSVTVANNGNQSLSITGIAVTGANAGEFPESNTCGSSVAAGANCTISVIFQPTATGTRTAAVTLADNGAGIPQSVSLTGLGAAPVPSLSPTSLTIASQPVGATSAPQSLILNNTGNAALSITSIDLSGPNPSDFAQTNNCGSSVAAGADCTINVTFQPTAAGTRSAAVTLIDDFSRSPHRVTVNGTGTAPRRRLFHPALSLLPAKVVGATSVAQTVTLSNSGNAALSVSGLSLFGSNPGDFVQSNNCGASVAARANCTISITFTPSASGSRTAALSIADNAAGSPQAVSLSGSGTASVASVSPGSLTFAGQALGATSPAQTVTLSNSGNAALSVSGLALSGSNPGDFVQSNNCGASVAAGANCTITITFSPSASGTRSAALSIADNAAGSPQAVSLSGSGTASVASVSPTSLTFTGQTVGATSAAQSVTLSNSGNAALSVSGLALSGSNPGDFVQSNNCGASVAAGANCTISITFTPSATGSRTAALSIADNAAGSPQAVSLSGSGTASAASVLSRQPDFHRPNRRRHQPRPDRHPQQLRQRRLECQRTLPSPAPIPATLSKAIIAALRWRQAPTAPSASPSPRPPAAPARPP